MYYVLQSGAWTIDFTFLGAGDGVNFSRQFAPEQVEANVQRLRRLEGATSSARIIPQVNYEVCISPAAGDADIPSAALVTTQTNDALVLMPADCIPIVLGSGTERPICALIHAGRRELDSGIIERTLQLIERRYGTPAADVTAYLGPGIKQRSYRLPLSIVDTLAHDGWEPHITRMDDMVLLDTFGFAHAELERGGVQRDNITESNIDTVTDPNCYSYYGRTRLGHPAGSNGCAVVVRRKS